MSARLLSQKLESLSQKLPSLINDCVVELNDFIVDLNKNQLKEGIRSDDVFIGYYSKKTLKIKAKNGLSPISKNNEIALYNYGSFWKSIIADVVGNQLILYASDDKTDMLYQRYGEQIIGLTNDSLNILIDKITELLFEKIKLDFDGV
jgi:hypothetical protein